jgi:glutamate/tyrosine decarboxylase-like PLP-dependent enzyme
LRQILFPTYSALVTEARELLKRTADMAADFLESLSTRPVASSAHVDELRAALGGALPEGPTDPLEVLEELAARADPGIVASPSGRFFGFVIGGGLPVSVAADWLTSAWDQNAGLYAAGPSASVVEEVVHGWLADLFRLPQGTSFAITTGCQMAHVTCLAAARHQVLTAAGWDLAERGLAGSPPIRVLVGERRHATVDRALRYLGIGRSQVRPVPADGQGRMVVEALVDELAGGSGPTMVCAQAGEVNTGAFDDLATVADAVEGSGAWLHVDGAFGLWAAASPELSHLVNGLERADSWAADAHKWLNVPYDSGLAFTAHPEHHRAALSVSAEYLVHTAPDGPRDQMDWTLEFSRRARGFAVYAALRSLGRGGVAEMISRCCRHARRFAKELAALPGAEVLNDVVLNQVLVRFGSDGTTQEVLRRVQESGEAWMSGTLVEGRRAIRVSVSNWQTNEDDVTRAIEAFGSAVAASSGA